jgi:hypothetical protein
MKAAPQDEVHIPIKSLRDAFEELRKEANAFVYPSDAELYEDLDMLQKLSFLTIDGDKIVVNRRAFLNATDFIEKQLNMLVEDRYGVLEKLKQKAPQLLEKRSFY